METLVELRVAGVNIKSMQPRINKMCNRYRRCFTGLDISLLIMIFGILCIVSTVNSAENIPKKADDPVASKHPGVVTPPDAPGVAAKKNKEDKPVVTIIQESDKTIEQYRIGGRLRYAKIIPKEGKPYYMVDTDENGSLDTRYNDLENPPINQTILIEW